jgi:hypothetical protein
MIKLKAFIYRFSAIFGLRIYLAQKEEDTYIDSLGKLDRVGEGCSRGLWQAEYGFTTIWTYKEPFFKALIAKIKHAFDFRSYE